MKRFTLTILSAITVSLVSTTARATLLQIDSDKSEITVAVSSTINSFVARLKKFDAHIECTTNLERPDKALVSFDFKDLKTGDDLRDKHMLAWLQYTAFTNSIFQLTEWKQNDAEILALGELTIHGVKQAIAMPVTITRTNDQCNIDGVAVLNYRDYQLPLIRKMLFITVNPELKVTFHLTTKSP